MYRLAGNLDTSHSVPGRNSVHEVSGLLSISKPTVATISNYLSDKTNSNIDSTGILAGMRKVKVQVE